MFTKCITTDLKHKEIKAFWCGDDEIAIERVMPFCNSYFITHPIEMEGEWIASTPVEIRIASSYGPQGIVYIRKR